MTNDQFDVIVLGGGPGGSTAATFLAKAGRKVLLLEKEFFPRFHIGESLLPRNQTILRELGVLDEVKAAGFPVKHGAQFHLGNGTLGTRFVFRDGRFNREPITYQVERAVFDHILLKHSRASKAEVLEGWQATNFSEIENGIQVSAVSAKGEEKNFRAKYLIDSTGRNTVTGIQENTRMVHPDWKKIAIFGHFHNVALDSGEAAGDTIIVRLETKWFWIIPVSKEKTSVGLVLDKDEFAAGGLSVQETFDKWVTSSTVAATRLANAVPVGQIRTTSDFSYTNTRLVGKRWLRVGDAAGFMDPIFSAGVFLAMWSAKLAAEALDRKLATNAEGGRAFAAYEKRFRHGMEFYWKVVRQYYTKPFIELFLQPRNHHDIPSAVNAVLAGEIECGWALQWRLKYFFILVKIQKHFPLVPRISFEPSGVKTPMESKPLLQPS